MEYRRNDTRKRRQMKLTIFAATGGIGRQLLEQAVDAGHEVTAVVRHPQKLPDELSGQVHVVPGDLAAPDPATLTAAVQGADGVLSGLGPRSKAETGIATRGTQAIVAAVKTAGARRIVVVSAARGGRAPPPAAQAQPAQARPGRRVRHAVPAQPADQDRARPELRRSRADRRHPPRQ